MSWSVNEIEHLGKSMTSYKSGIYHICEILSQTGMPIWKQLSFFFFFWSLLPRKQSFNLHVCFTVYDVNNKMITWKISRVCPEQQVKTCPELSEKVTLITSIFHHNWLLKLSVLQLMKYVGLLSKSPPKKTLKFSILFKAFVLQKTFYYFL